jgi:hypothetical protein
MDQYLELVRDQLEQACFEGAHRPRWRRRIDVRPARLMAVAVSTAVVVAVVLVAFGVGGTRGSSPPTGSPPRLPLAEQIHVNNIIERILGPLFRTCGHVRPRRHLSISYGAPDSEMLSTLGVLRRSATPVDTLRPFLHAAGLNVAHGIYVRYVRLARTYRGTSYYIVPAADIGSMDAQCVAAGRAALRKGLSHVPVALRRVVAQQGDAQLVEVGPGEGVFLNTATAYHQERGDGSPVRIQDIRTQGGDFGFDGDGGVNLTLSGIVPDGVASVTITIARNGERPQTVAGRPVGNVLVVPLRVPARGPIFGQATMVWKASDGHVIRVIKNAPL